MRLNPRGGVGYRNLGNSLQMAGRSLEAIEAFNQAAWINPLDAESHFRLGYAYLMGGNLDLAYQQYRLLLPLDPANARALFLGGHFLGQFERNRGADANHAVGGCGQDRRGCLRARPYLRHPGCSSGPGLWRHKRPPERPLLQHLR